MRTRILNVLVIALLLFTGAGPLQVKAQGGSGEIYLPTLFNNYNPLAGMQVVNVPYLPYQNVVSTGFYQMEIFWFGKVRLDSNYTDVRIGYNDQALWIHLATFDRRLWYDSSSSPTESWDAATLLIHTDGNASPSRPETNSYRIAAQMGWQLEVPNEYTSYQGNGAQWIAKPVSISNYSGWEGIAPNDSVDDRGWKMIFKIPFSSLGLSGKPATGSVWRFGLQVHDRDSAAGPALANQSWPTSLNKDVPSTWGLIRFGVPVYATPGVVNRKTTTIRHGLNGAVVPDADVGGWAVCGEGLNMWTEWGEKNYAGQREVNIQNQQNLGDWPCFSKYYVTFPLDSIPLGKVIRSAKLVMHQFGGSDPSQASSSLIHVMRVAQNWDENTLNWNNAPLVLENISSTWVGVFDGNRTDYCPGDAYEWDVSRAMVQAYGERQPLRLALYSTDFDLHSGKYFYSSDSNDCGGTSRPTLIVEWGDPQ